MVDALKLTFDSTGEGGDALPGWSVQNTVTPHVFGVGNQGTGAASISIAYGVDSEFLIDSQVTAVQERLGPVQGLVTALQFAGSDGMETAVSLSIQSVIGGLNAARIAPPLVDATVEDVYSTYVGLIDPNLTVANQSSNATVYNLPGWEAPVWQMLGEFAAVSTTELVLQGNGLVIRDQFVDPLELDDNTVPQYQFVTSGEGQQFDVINYNVEPVQSGDPILFNFSPNPSVESDLTGWTGVWV